MTDERLLAVLAQSGHLDPDGVHRAARPDICPDCRRPVLVGLDAERCATVARTDPHEIDVMGEFLATRLGLMTYNLSRGFSKKGKQQWVLDTRMICQIEAPRRTAVVAAHRCGIAIPPATVTFLSPRPRRARSGSDAAPF